MTVAKHPLAFSTKMECDLLYTQKCSLFIFYCMNMKIPAPASTMMAIINRMIFRIKFPYLINREHFVHSSG